MELGLIICAWKLFEIEADNLKALSRYPNIFMRKRKVIPVGFFFTVAGDNLADFPTSFKDNVIFLSIWSDTIFNNMLLKTFPRV